MSGRSSIYGLTREQLAGVLVSWGESRFRAGQIYSWLYRKRPAGPEAMSNLPRALRKKLSGSFDFSLPEVSSREQSEDGTTKYRLVMVDGEAIECVAMPESKAERAEGGIGLCISSQAGCALGCTFCRTGAVGFRRDLNTAEIVLQVLLMLDDQPCVPSHINVLIMGMGEPLLNLDALEGALAVIGDPEGLAVPMRRVVVSTAGIPDGIRRLYGNPALPRLPRLALSLNAPDQRLREELMPVARRYPLGKLLAVVKELPPARERLTIEYVLIAGVNDRPEQARELTKLLRGMKVVVNLIPFNSCEGIPFAAPDEAAIERFLRVLVGNGLRCTVRRSRGRSVCAACGQLAGR